jgi:transcriptional antiterminator/mannitol/fructose-specific phosphotransferase system IIA component (Ntr-type)
VDELKLNKRHIKEIKFLLNLNTKTTSKELGKVLSIKQRTLKEDLKLISAFFNNFGVELVREPRVGIYIKSLNNEQKVTITKAVKDLEVGNSKLDKSERFRSILLETLILDDIPTIEDLANEFNVSSFTISQDMKEIKEWLKEKGITLTGVGGRGYHIGAKEEDIRKAILNALELNTNLDFKYELFKLFCKNLKGEQDKPFSQKKYGQIINDVETLIANIERETGIEIADEDYQKFFCSILICFLRTALNHMIIANKTQLDKFKQIKEFNIIFQNLEKFYEKYHIAHAIEDSSLITLTFITLKINNFDISVENFSKNTEGKYEIYTNLVITLIKELFSPSLNFDSEFQRMFALHLQRTFKKIILGVTIENPLLQDIKREYPFEFSIADKVSRLLEKKVGIKFPEAEKGYIAVYIKVALEKNRSKKKVIILCPSGLITSNLIYFRLKNEMPELDVALVSSLEDFSKAECGYSADLIVSTVSVPNSNIPSVVVSPLLTQEDKNMIREKLQSNEGKRMNVSWEMPLLINQDLIFTNLGFCSYNELLLYLGTKLFEAGYVKEGYPKQLLDSEKKSPTGISTPVPIAIPHTQQKLSLKNCILIATLKKPVLFREMGNSNSKLGVRIVLIPVFSTNAEKNVEFFDGLLKKLSDFKLANKILQATTKEELYNLIT